MSREPLDAQDQENVDEDSFPVTKVVLSKHGVGYFQRKGQAAPGTSIELFFKSKDMNDVLKSLAMVEVNRGLVSSISYESTKEASDELEGLSLKLSETSSIKDLLVQLKGTEVSLDILKKEGESAVAEVVTGVVIGLESRAVHSPSYHTRTMISVLANGLFVQFFDLAKVGKITLKSEVMQAELRHILRTVLNAKKKDLKSITAYTSSETKEKNEKLDIIASYILEAPVWKTSFRVLLNSKGQSLFQAWALVDNTQNEDWHQVELFLTSGAQHSFVYDLYNARYVKRREIKVKEEETMGPVVIEDAVAQHQSATLEAAPLAPVLPSVSKPFSNFSAKMMQQQSMSAPPPPPGASSAPPPPMAPSSSPFLFSMSSSSSSSSSVPSMSSLSLAAAPLRRSMASSSMKKEKSRSGGGGGGRGRMMSDEEEEERCAEESAPAASYDYSAAELADEIEQKEEEAPAEQLDAFVNYDQTSSLANSVNVKTETKDSDSSFQCKIATLVNINRNQSALVPFVQAEFKGEKISIFNNGVRAANPVAVLKFPNTFGIPLESGPLSIYEDGVYVGEAILPDFKSSTNATENIQYIAYSVDLKCTITLERESTTRDPYYVSFSDPQNYRTTRDIHSSPAYVIFHSWLVHSTTYVIDNTKNKKDVALIIEHPRKIGTQFQLFESPLPSSTTANFFRFSLDLKAESVVKLVVREREISARTRHVTELSKREIEDWLLKETILQPVADILVKIVDAVVVDAALKQDHQELIRQRQDCDNDVSRVRNSQTVINRLRELLDKQASALHDRQKQEEDLEETITKRENEVKDFKAKNPNMKAPGKIPSKTDVNELAYTDWKTKSDRLASEQERLKSLKKQNISDTENLNTLNNLHADRKAKILPEIKLWEDIQKTAQGKENLANSVWISNREVMDKFNIEVVRVGGSRYTSPDAQADYVVYDKRSLT